MTDQEINLKCAKYLWPDIKAVKIAGSTAVCIDDANDILIEFFTPATDANDRDLVFERLEREGWEFTSKHPGSHFLIFYKKPDDRYINYIATDTKKEANRAVLEKIINGSD